MVKKNIDIIYLAYYFIIMIHRQLEGWLEKQISVPQIIQIQGLRQTGKTTLMNAFRQQFPGAIHFPLQNLPILQRFEAEPQRFAIEIEQQLMRWKEKNREPLHVFVDEIQKVPLLYQALQGLYDSHKGKLKCWIWGSSARATKRKRAETLTGRILTKILWPLSQQEINNHESIIPHLLKPTTWIKHSVTELANYVEKLQQALLQSLLPEAYLAISHENAYALLESYQATYLENEIRRENWVSDIGLFQRFLILAATENGEIVNHAAKAKVLDISPITIKNYYNILEDTFVCKLLPAYSQSFRVQVSKSPKIYFTDTGLARFVAGHRGILYPETQPFGNAFESFVIMELFKQIEYYSLPWKLFYFRTKTGIEADCIIKTPEQTIVCEIKSTKKVSREHYKDIQKIFEMDRKISFGIVFSLDPRIGEIAPKIYNMPAWNL